MQTPPRCGLPCLPLLISSTRPSNLDKHSAISGWNPHQPLPPSRTHSGGLTLADGVLCNSLSLTFVFLVGGRRRLICQKLKCRGPRDLQQLRLWEQPYQPTAPKGALKTASRRPSLGTNLLQSMCVLARTPSSWGHSICRPLV